MQAQFLTSAVSAKQWPQSSYPEFCLIGKSNVGKSTLINTLTNHHRLARKSKVPGKTETLNFYLLNQKVILTDTPGYGYTAKSHATTNRFGKMMEQYLKDRAQLRLILWLIDGRHDLSATDQTALAYLAQFNRPCLIVLTKADKLSNQQRLNQYQKLKAQLNLPSVALVWVSSTTKFGLESLTHYLQEYIPDFPQVKF